MTNKKADRTLEVWSAVLLAGQSCRTWLGTAERGGDLCYWLRPSRMARIFSISNFSLSLKISLLIPAILLLISLIASVLVFSDASEFVLKASRVTTLSLKASTSANILSRFCWVSLGILTPLLWPELALTFLIISYLTIKVKEIKFVIITLNSW